VAGRKTPTLKNGDTVLNLNDAIPDNFLTSTNVVSTVFVREGDDLVRVLTSIKTENGQRALGTILARNHPGYQRLMEGKSYSGQVILFNTPFMTQYNPIIDANGKVIGALFIGMNFGSYIKAIKEQIRSFKIGDDGYFYVVDTTPGATFGKLLIHPTREGEDYLGTRDARGHEFVKEMLQREQGVIYYPLINRDAGETEVRGEVAVFATMKNWNWLIVGSGYADEITQEAKVEQARYGLIGLGMVFILAALIYPAIRSLISKPLQLATHAAQKLAAGDLTATLQVKRQDEIGQLMHAINGIGSNLTNLVGNVREATDSIVNVSQQMAAGNMDLSSRTQLQTSALEETAVSIHELTTTVMHNADNAQQANNLAKSASEVAVQGGEMVAKVVDTMGSINDSSKKIVNIISVIDDIAFQTNILALNAAVEAARGGEQGRGFAVVASEVRNLAQRSAAAREIKTLIDDSVHKVDVGADLVDQAGKTMQQIVDSISRVTTTMGEITVASEEQTSGIAQVNQAINQMESATQRNAELVEQAAAAAQDLQDQARGLLEKVSVFNLASSSRSYTPALVHLRLLD
jgi:methyl-accepting chemotaxis protein